MSDYEKDEPGGVRKISKIDLTASIVTVAVGEKPICYRAHEDLLRSRSTFFRAALSKRWKQGKEAIIQLPEDSADHVKAYLGYLYTHTIPIMWTTEPANVPNDEHLPEYKTLAHLYVFGEKIGDITFKNAIVDAFLKRMRKEIGSTNYYPVREAVDIIYRGTTAASPLRKLMIEAHVLEGREAWISVLQEENNPEFLFDLARALMVARTSGTRGTALDTGDGRYHESLPL